MTIDTRVTQADDDRVEETNAVRIPEQALPVERLAWVDAIYFRVCERSPSTVHPSPAGDYLHRVVEAWRRSDIVDYRILQHQFLAHLRLDSQASLRVRVGGRHFLYASRARIQLTARSDTRKTRALS